MIFSKQRKYIFLRSPKTGSTAITNLLKTIDKSARQNEVTLCDGRIIKVNTHITAKEVIKILGNEREQYAIVSFTRDPITLVRSKYHFYRSAKALRGVEGRWRAIGVFIRIIIAKILPFSVWVLVYPCKTGAHFICDANGNLIADRVGRQEFLTADVCRIFSELIDLPENMTILEENASTYNKDTRVNGIAKLIIKRRYSVDYEVLDALKYEHN